MSPRWNTLCSSLSLVALLASLTGSVSAQPPKAPPPPPGKGQNLGTLYVAPPAGLALFKQALAATNAGRFAEAERLYRQVVKEAPDAGAAWANLGLLIGRQGRIEEAIGYLTKATQVAPETAPFWAQLSVYQLRGAHWKDAEKSARQALAREPKNALALANLADSLLPQRRFADAIPVLRRLTTVEGAKPTDHTQISLILALSGNTDHNEAVTLAQKRAARLPKDVNTYLLLGDTARRAGNLPIAEKAYRQALTLDPKNASAQGGLIATTAQQGNSDVALKLIEQRLKKEPKNALLYFQKGYLLYNDTRIPNEKRFPQAEAAFRSAATLDPKNPLYLTYSGIILMMQGAFPHLPEDKEPPAGARGWDIAENYLHGALQLSPKLTMARLALANIALLRKQPEEAKAHFQAILSYAPNDRDAHRGIAGIYYAANKKTEAYAEMQTIATLFPQDTEILGELASWYVADNRLDDARRTYEQILQRDPANAPAHIALGRMAEEAKNLAGAVKQYEAAFDAQPRNEQAAILFGTALVQQNRTEEAINVYRQFLNAVPDNNIIRWQLAQTLRDKKRYDEAFAELQRLTLRQGDTNRLLYMLAPANLLIEQKRYDEAIRTLLQVQAEHPKEDEPRYQLASAYDKAGQSDKAETLLKEIIARPPDPAQRNLTPVVRPHLQLAEMYERASAWDEAATQYETVLRLDAQQKAALFGLSRVRDKQNKSSATLDFLEGLATADEKTPHLAIVGDVHQLFAEQKHWEEWRAFTKRLLDKYPQNRDMQYVRARSLVEENQEEGNRKEAITLMEQIMAKNPKDLGVQRFLAKTLEAAGRKEEAINAYRAVLKLQATDADALASLRRLGAK